MNTFENIIATEFIKFIEQQQKKKLLNLNISEEQTIRKISKIDDVNVTVTISFYYHKHQDFHTHGGINLEINLRNQIDFKKGLEGVYYKSLLNEISISKEEMIEILKKNELSKIHLLKISDECIFVSPENLRTPFVYPVDIEGELDLTCCVCYKKYALTNMDCGNNHICCVRCVSKLQESNGFVRCPLCRKKTSGVIRDPCGDEGKFHYDEDDDDDDDINHEEDSDEDNTELVSRATVTETVTE